ncbi:hypothetical protein ACIFQM_10325 [Paenibacillus sp. NRS-1782]
MTKPLQNLEVALATNSQVRAVHATESAWLESDGGIDSFLD